MLQLNGRVIEIVPVPRAADVRGRIFKLFENGDAAPSDPARAAYLLNSSGRAVAGFGVYVLVEGQGRAPSGGVPGPVIRLPASQGYLAAGDVISVSQDGGKIRSLYRRSSSHNHFLVTERCDNYCVMCSQPPKDVNDEWLVDEILDAIPLLDGATRELGFTGGEPTLLGGRFLDVLRACKMYLPSTAVHVLSNGRRFSDESFARDWAGVGHPDLMVGIPIYSDMSYEHDFVVQADGAYDETVRGILNLKRFRQRVEIRVVIHRHTYLQLPRLAEFLARNLVFVDHVALMGLELMGFAKANYGDLWIDPPTTRHNLSPQPMSSRMRGCKFRSTTISGVYLIDPFGLGR